MGVLTLQLLVCGQLILFSLAAENKTNPHQNVSTSDMTSPSQIKSSVTAEPLNTTGNNTTNNVSTPSGNVTHYFNETGLSSSTTPMTPTMTQNTTSALNQSNATLSGSTVKPNATTTNTTTTQLSNTNQTSTTASSTTVNISTTNITSQNTTTYSNTTVSTTSNTSPSTKPTEKASTTVTQNNSTDIKSLVGLSHSEKSLTVLFSALLGVIVVTVLVYLMHKYRKRKQMRVLYTHRRLQSDDTGDQFAATDDTLVISGGLYDGPQIYNPTMTVQNEDDFQTDASGFGYASTQFRLEFLKDEQRRAPDRDASTFQTFYDNDQEL